MSESKFLWSRVQGKLWNIVEYSFQNTWDRILVQIVRNEMIKGMKDIFIYILFNYSQIRVQNSLYHPPFHPSERWKFYVIKFIIGWTVYNTKDQFQISYSSWFYYCVFLSCWMLHLVVWNGTEIWTPLVVSRFIALI